MATVNWSSNELGGVKPYNDISYVSLNVCTIKKSIKLIQKRIK